MRPHLAITVSTSFFSSSLLPTLQGTAIASWPRAANSARTASHTSALRLDTTTRAPALAICSMMDLPMPRDDPVTSATLSFRLNMGSGPPLSSNCVIREW
ncbi:hypothetical protein D3C83_08820 [compost metagenome]